MRSTGIPDLAEGRSRIEELDSLIESEPRRRRGKDRWPRKRERDARMAAIAQAMRAHLTAGNQGVTSWRTRRLNRRWWIDGKWNLFQDRKV